VAMLALLLLVGPLICILLFRFMPPPVTPLMVIRLVQGHGLQQRWVGYDRIAPALAHAVIASEDNFFCTEPLGFDVSALRKEAAIWWDGERPRGASTITMQTAKNVFLWPGRDPVRKLAEAWLTPQIALLWPKRRILEVYLNVVEFGPGVYGAEAAARSFFRKSAADLSPHEAAQLASVLPRPLVWSAARPEPFLRHRAAGIEGRIPEIRALLECAR
jgi:monofunctional biosynthetic peptidoglycan transglycosylase